MTTDFEHACVVPGPHAGVLISIDGRWICEDHLGRMKARHDGIRSDERTRIVAWLRKRALVWRNAVHPIPRDNILVADTFDGAANSIERDDLEEEP